MNPEANIDVLKRKLAEYYNEKYILKPTDHLFSEDFRVLWFHEGIGQCAGTFVSPYYHLEETRFEVFYDQNNAEIWITAMKQVDRKKIDLG